MIAKRVQGDYARDTFQADRVIIGHCPQCGAVAVIFNNHEVWPYVVCECGWKGATTLLVHHTRFVHTRLGTLAHPPASPEVDR